MPSLRLLSALVIATASATAPAESPRDLDPAKFAGPIFLEKNGMFIVEGESVPLSKRWELRTDAALPGGCARSRMDAEPKRFTGKGYMRWNGPTLNCKSQGKPEIKEEGPEKHGDLTQGCQGPSSDWMVMKLWVENAGPYEVDIRSYHLKEDGDNDVWIGHFGQTTTILRQTNCRTQTYSWGNYTRTVPLKKGLNAVYISGRSTGFGVDRVAIFKPERADAARDPKAPESPRRAAAAVTGAAGQVLVLHKWAESLGFYDRGTGQPLRPPLPVGPRPHEMALAADGRSLFITNYGVNSYTDEQPGANTVTVVDVPRAQVVSTIDMGKHRRPHGIERGRSGRMYVTTDHPAALLVIDAGARKVIARHLLPDKLPHMLALAPDERVAYVANSGSGSVTVLDLRSGKVKASVSVGGVPMGLALTRDGRTLYATTRAGNAVAVIDTGTQKVSATIALSGQPVRAALTPDESRLLVTLIESGELALVDTAARTVLRRIPVGGRAEGIFVDGGTVFVSAQADDKVTAFDLEDWAPRLSIATASRPDPILAISGGP